MKNLSHTPEVDSLRGTPLASWPQSLVSVSIEAQTKPDGPWEPSKTKAAIKADQPDADDIVERWTADARDLVTRGKLHSWRIVLSAEPQVHSFHAQVAPPKPAGRVLSSSFVPHTDISDND